MRVETLPHGRLFVYMKAVHAKEVLTTRKVRFSSPKRFNDPYDSQLNPFWNAESDQCKAWAREWAREVVAGPIAPIASGNETIDAVITRTRKKYRLAAAPQKAKLIASHEREYERLLALDAQWWADMVEKNILRWRVWCASEVGDDTVMWAHYGDNHTGVALVLDPQHLTWDVGLSRVKYQAGQPTLIRTYKDVRNLLHTIDGAYTPQQLTECLIVKTSKWEYEKEWRFIFQVPDSGLGYTDRLIEQPSALVGLRFGLRMPEADKAAISTLARAWPAMTIESMQKNSSSIGLQPVSH